MWIILDSPLEGLLVKFYEGAHPTYPQVLCKKPPRQPSNNLVTLNLFDNRIEVMGLWGRFCCSANNVVKLAKSA